MTMRTFLIRLLPGILSLSLSGCLTTYEAPPSLTMQTGANLTVTKIDSDTGKYTARVKLHRIDGVFTKSVENSFLGWDYSVLLVPGQHKIEVILTLDSLFDHMSEHAILTAQFEAGTQYAIRTDKPQVNDRLGASPMRIWIETTSGVQVSPEQMITPTRHEYKRQIMILPSGSSTPMVTYH